MVLKQGQVLQGDVLECELCGAAGAGEQIASAGGFCFSVRCQMRAVRAERTEGGRHTRLRSSRVTTGDSTRVPQRKASRSTRRGAGGARRARRKSAACDTRTPTSP